jgi:hypothetical protein
MSGTISPTCSAMKRSCSKPSSRKETVAPDGPPIVRSTTLQVHRTPHRGKALRCGPWRFSNHHAQPSFIRSLPTRKACVGERRPFVVLAYCLKKQLRAFFERLVFYRIQSYCLAPCRFLGRLRHIVLSILAAIFFLPSLLPYTHTTR